MNMKIPFGLFVQWTTSPTVMKELCVGIVWSEDFKALSRCWQLGERAPFLHAEVDALQWSCHECSSGCFQLFSIHTTLLSSAPPSDSHYCVKSSLVTSLSTYIMYLFWSHTVGRTHTLDLFTEISVMIEGKLTRINIFYLFFFCFYASP